MSQASGHGERRGVAGAQPRGVAAGNKRAALGTGPRPGDELATGPFPGGLCWADDSSIWQANLDGTNIQDLLSAWEPTMGVAVDSSHVYWINRNTGAVRRANPDGSNLQDLVPGQFALATGGVAVDASHLYWTSYAGGPTAGTIRRANLDGSNPQAIVPGQAAPFGIAVDASHLYWTNSGDGTIWRASLDGTNAQSIVQGEGQDSLFAVAVDASHLYWTNRSRGMVKRADLEGTDPQTLLLGQNQPQAVAVDATYVYWSNLGDQTGAIRRADLVDGANPQVLIPNTRSPQLMVAVPPAPPELGFTPSPYDFGEVTAGQPASQAFTLANTGATASGTLAVTLAGQAGFTKSGDTCTGTSLGPGQSCTVSVQFTPASYAPLSATLTAAGQDPAATAAVALTGSGVGHLYWTNNPTGGGFPEGSVIMANRDGSGQRELFSGQDVPTAVAVGGGHLYWVTNNSDSEDPGTIHRANLDGSDPQTIVTGQNLATSPGGGAMPLLVSCELSFRELTSVVHDAGYASVDRVI